MRCAVWEGRIERLADCREHLTKNFFREQTYQEEEKKESDAHSVKPQCINLVLAPLSREVDRPFATFCIRWVLPRRLDVFLEEVVIRFCGKLRWRDDVVV